MAKEHQADGRRRSVKQKKGVVNRQALWKLAYVMLLVCAVQFQGQARAATFITFDVPGSPGTFPAAINPEGVITGWYNDTNSISHGFVLASNGSITTFDPPGASCPSFSICTQPAAISPAGAITGFCCDAITCHGFVRASNGTFTTFDSPGSAATYPTAIKPGGGDADPHEAVKHALRQAPGQSLLDSARALSHERLFRANGLWLSRCPSEGFRRQGGDHLRRGRDRPPFPHLRSRPVRLRSEALPGAARTKARRA